MKGKLSRTESISRFMRYWLNEGFSIRAVVVFLCKDCRTKKDNDLIKSCRNTRQALTKLEEAYNG